MNKTRRELVRRAIEFDSPWRMPVCSSPMVTTFTDDIVYLFPEFQGNKYWTGEGGDDEWGCRWELSPDTKDMGQVVGHPLKDLRALDRLPRPNGLNPARYVHLDVDLRQAEDRYVAFCNGSCLFERAHMLRGFAQFFEDLYDDPEGVDALLDFIVQYHFDTVEYLAAHFPGRIHAYRMTDDWGTQLGPMISPALFRRFFFPRYQRLFARCHQAGMHVWLHSCGKHEDLLELLVEAGLDVANLCQPAIFDIPSFGKRFAGRLAFEAAGDMQKTLVQGDPRAIRDEAASLMCHWTTDKGGWLLMTEMAAESNGIDPATGEIMIEAFKAVDRWKG
ncbi:MAG: uroporphyrinogen decarboxylase family protein [Armatimonadota bacterium]